MAVVDIVVVESLINQQLALTTSYSASPAANTRLFATGLRDMIKAFDGQLVVALLGNANFARRRDFILTVALANGAQIPSHIGPLDDVRINGIPASLASLDVVRRYRTNALAVPTDPYYSVQGTRIFHTATSSNFSTTTADVDYCDYTPDNSTNLCKAPAEYTAIEVAGCLALLASIDGDDTPLAGLYQTILMSYMQMVAGGAVTVPDLGQMMQQQAA